MALEFHFNLIQGIISNPPPNNPLTDFLSSGIWQSVSVFIAIITLFFSIHISRKRPSRKEIICDLISDAMVLSAAEEVKKRVKFLLDNKPVSDLSLVILKVWNSGNASILPTDFRRPLKIDFGGAEVIEAEVLETTSRGVKEEAKTSLKRNSKNLTLEPLLLNSKESINLKVLLTGHTTNKVQADTHIIEGGLQTRTSVWETSKISLIIWAIVFMFGGEILGFEVQWNIYPLLNYNTAPILIALVHLISLFLKNLCPSVLGSYFWIKNSTRLRTMRSVFVFWLIYSLFLSLPLALVVLLFTLLR